MEKYTGGNFMVYIPPVEVNGNFASVSGLNAELEYEEYTEGGTFFPAFLVKGLRYERIVLRRGTMPMEPLALWFETVRAGSFMKYPMVITMLDNSRTPVKIWTVLDAMSGRVSLTSIELVHGEIIPVM